MCIDTVYCTVSIRSITVLHVCPLLSTLICSSHQPSHPSQSILPLHPNHDRSILPSSQARRQSHRHLPVCRQRQRRHPRSQVLRHLVIYSQLASYPSHTHPLFFPSLLTETSHPSLAYHWLETPPSESPETQRWVDDQVRLTTDEFNKVANKSKLEAALRKVSQPLAHVPHDAISSLVITIWWNMEIIEAHLTPCPSARASSTHLCRWLPRGHLRMRPSRLVGQIVRSQRSISCLASTKPHVFAEYN